MKKQRTISSKYFVIIAMLVIAIFTTSAKTADASMISTIKDFFHTLFNKNEQAYSVDVPAPFVKFSNHTGTSSVIIQTPKASPTPNKTIIATGNPTQITSILSSGISDSQLQTAISNLRTELLTQLRNTNSPVSISGNYVTYDFLNNQLEHNLDTVGDNLTHLQQSSNNSISQLSSDLATLTTTVDNINAAISGQWMNNGANLYYTGGRVSIGTTTADSVFNVSGNVIQTLAKISGNIGGPGADYYNATALQLENLGTNGQGGAVELSFKTRGSLANLGIFNDASTTPARLYFYDANNNPGFLFIMNRDDTQFYTKSFTTSGTLNVASTTGTSTIAGNFSVAGNMNVNGTLLKNGVPFVGSQWTTNGSNINFTGGNVGIGSTTPSRKLVVDEGTVSGYTDQGALVVAGNRSSAYDQVAINVQNSGSAFANLNLISNAGAWSLISGGNGHSPTSQSLRIYKSGGDNQGSALYFGSNRAISVGGGDDNSLLGTFTVLGMSGMNPFVVASSSGTQLITLNQTGNLGIGTSSPYAKLSVEGNIVGSRIFATSTSNSVFGNGTSGGIQIGDSTITKSAGNAFTFNSGISAVSWVGNLSFGFGQTTATITTDSAKPIAFSPNGEKMRIDSTGNVGIGTTSPYAKLSVSDSTLNGSYLALARGTNNRFDFGMDSASNYISTIGKPLYVGTADSQVLTFKTNNANRLTIDANGNTGIGTTNPGSFLDIALMPGLSTPGTIRLSRSDGVARFVEIIANNSALASGNTLDFALNNGTVGATTSVMTLVGNGNVGIGTTSPYAQLSVAGNAVFDGKITVSSIVSTSTTGTSTFAGPLYFNTPTTNNFGSQATIWDYKNLGPTAAMTYGGLLSITTGYGGGLRIGTLSSSRSSGLSSDASLIINSGDTNALFIKGPTNALKVNTATDINTVLLTASGQFTLINQIATSSIFNVKGATSQSGNYFTVSSSSGTGDIFNISSGGNVGIGTTTPAGKLTVYSGSAGGVTAASVADDLIIEGSSDVGISLLSTNNSERFINFGSPSSNESGQIRYSPTSGVMQLKSAGQFFEVYGKLKAANGGASIPTYSFINGSTTGMFLSGDNTKLGFSTAGTERLTIDGLGNVGIGTTSPSNKLDVEGRIRAYSSTGNIGLSVHYMGSGGREYQILSCQGCGTTSVGGLEIYDATASAGRAYIQAGVNGWQTPSDLRLKDNVQTLSVLDKINSIRGVSYIIKDSGMPQIGVIAQEIMQVFPEAVSGSTDEGHYLGVSYNSIAAIALEGVRELNIKVDSLSTGSSTSSSIPSQSSSLAIFADIISDSYHWTTGKIAVATGYFQNIFAKNIDTKNLNAETATVENGITVKDKQTGEYYCIVVDGGTMKNVPGSCDTQTASPSPSPSIQPTPTPESSPEISPSPSVTPTASPSPTPSNSPEPSPEIPTTDQASSTSNLQN